MRRFVFPMIALSLVTAPVVVEAQTSPPAARAQAGPFGLAAGNPAERVLRHREALGLSAEQVSRLEQLSAQFAAQNEPLIAQVRAVRPQLGQRGQRGDTVRARRQQLTEEQRAEMRQRRLERLTPEQRAEMERRREQMRDATPEQRRQMREEMRQRMQQLTPEQRAEMRQRRGGARMQQLTPEQRQQFEALRPVMEQLRQNHEQARQQVQAVLTAEQQSQLRELMVQRRGERPKRPGSRQGARQDARR